MIGTNRSKQVITGIESEARNELVSNDLESEAGNKVISFDLGSEAGNNPEAGIKYYQFFAICFYL